MSKNTKRVIALVVAAILILIGIFVTPPEDLGVTGLRAFCILFAAIVLWFSQAIPTAFTCLLLVPAFKFMGVLTMSEITKAACSSSVFFLLAGFGIGAALIKTNVIYIVVRAILKFSGNDSGKIVSGLVVLTAVISLVVSNSVAVICVTSIAVMIIRSIGDPAPGTSGMAKGLMLGLPFGAMAGGVAMPCANSLNVVLMDLLESLCDVQIGFVQWTIVGFPIFIITTAFIAIHLPKAVKAEKLTDEQMAGFDEMFAKIPEHLEAKDWKFMIIVFCMLVAWLASNWVSSIDIASVAIIGVSLMFLPGIDLINNKDYMKEFKPLSILLLLCIMPLATAMRSSGAGEWLVNTVFKNSANWSTILMFVMVTIVALVIHFVVPSGSGNAAVSATLLFPITYAAGMPMLGVLMVLAIMCGNNYLIPVEGLFSFTIGYDHFTFGDCVKCGIPVTILSILICIIYCPLLGMLFG